MTIEKNNCDECIFKRYTFDKDGKCLINKILGGKS